MNKKRLGLLAALGGVGALGTYAALRHFLAVDPHDIDRARFLVLKSLASRAGKAVPGYKKIGQGLDGMTFQLAPASAAPVLPVLAQAVVPQGSKVIEHFVNKNRRTGPVLAKITVHVKHGARPPDVSAENERTALIRLANEPYVPRTWEVLGAELGNGTVLNFTLMHFLTACTECPHRDAALERQLQRAFLRMLAKGVLHGDLHDCNVLSCNGRLKVIDFSRALIMPRLKAPLTVDRAVRHVARHYGATKFDESSLQELNRDVWDQYGAETYLNLLKYGTHSGAKSTS